jgi:hypothetical protein
VELRVVVEGAHDGTKADRRAGRVELVLNDEEERIPVPE